MYLHIWNPAIWQNTKCPFRLISSYICNRLLSSPPSPPSSTWPPRIYLLNLILFFETLPFGRIQSVLLNYLFTCNMLLSFPPFPLSSTWLPRSPAFPQTSVSRSRGPRGSGPWPGVRRSRLWGVGLGRNVLRRPRCTCGIRAGGSADDRKVIKSWNNETNVFKDDYWSKFV